jgi:hypothetical protein
LALPGHTLKASARHSLPSASSCPLFTRVSGRSVLGSPYTKSCIAPVPIWPEMPDSPDPVPNPKPYILWCYMKMRCGGYAVHVRSHFIVGTTTIYFYAPGTRAGYAPKMRAATTSGGSAVYLRALLSACGIQPQTFFPFVVLLTAPQRLWGSSVGLLVASLLGGETTRAGARVTGFTDMCSNSSPSAMAAR